MDGTCSGSTDRQGKMKFIKAEHGPALATMRAISRPWILYILNPGKILPAT